MLPKTVALVCFLALALLAPSPNLIIASPEAVWETAVPRQEAPSSIATYLVEIPASKDNTLYEHASGALSNGAGQYLFSGRVGPGGGGGALRRGLIAFDVADHLPPEAIIVDAELTLFMSRSVSATPQSIELRRLLNDWGEGASQAGGEEGGGAPAEPGDATWLHTFFDDNFWAAPGGDFAGAVSAATLVSAVGAYSWSGPQMQDDVQSWLDAPAGNFGWLLLGNESVLSTSKRFNTRENSAAATRPILRVAYALPYALELSPLTAAMSGAPGETITYTLTLTNTGILSDSYDISAGGHDWTTQLSVDTLALNSGETTDLTVWVTIPSDAEGGDNDEAVITVVSVGDDQVMATATLTTTAVNPPEYALSLTPDMAAMSGEPGAALTYTLTLTNMGGVTDTIDLEAVGGSWPTTVTPTLVLLDSGSATTITVVVAIPLDAEDNASDTVTITATSAGDSDVTASAVLTSTAVIPPVYALDLAPETAAMAGPPGTIVTYILTLTNQGSVTDTIQLAAAGGSWPIALAPDLATVAPGGFIEVVVEVSIPPGAANNAADMAIITAVSSGDMNVTAVSTLTTMAVWRNLFLPIIMGGP
jgi:uncharacterized membrane protein